MYLGVQDLIQTKKCYNALIVGVQNKFWTPLNLNRSKIQMLETVLSLGSGINTGFELYKNVAGLIRSKSAMP
ncbi:hypothetical protein PN36_03680 [Candidatus Thiomargarita nelsonii]|uniref:Uncharacterized protein n=1 Tax=Candidatus Thiomargarita nelsonii TaxID=1003181 RepID=A0A4E0R6V3_9GAMM|nr:hypothetical protein PN36_03680 [Candidatus Thiomargarita nelsonii]